MLLSNLFLFLCVHSRKVRPGPEGEDFYETVAQTDWAVNFIFECFKLKILPFG